MSDSMVSLRRKISTASDLKSVVRTMKAQAASSIEQYEMSVESLGDYYRIVEMGLSLCFRQIETSDGHQSEIMPASEPDVVAVVFGSDQGLVGQFNETVVDYAVGILDTLPTTPKVWAVGERVYARLKDANVVQKGLFFVPLSIKAVTPLIGQILSEAAAPDLKYDDRRELHLFYNRPSKGVSYEPVYQRVLPLDRAWQRNLAKLTWPTKKLPEIIGGQAPALQSFIREYLFVSLFRACTESLASENASRLAAMQRAERNIDELLERLNGDYHRLRQSSIDEELFDVISGFEALNN